LCKPLPVAAPVYVNHLTIEQYLSVTLSGLVSYDLATSSAENMPATGAASITLTTSFISEYNSAGLALAATACERMHWWASTSVTAKSSHSMAFLFGNIVLSAQPRPGTSALWFSVNALGQSIHRANVHGSGSQFVVVLATHSGFDDISRSLVMRTGASSAEKTEWFSQSSVYNKHPSGVGGWLPFTISIDTINLAGTGLGTFLKAASYRQLDVSSVIRSNIPQTSSVSFTILGVAGSEFGTQGLMHGWSAAEVTSWTSESVLVARGAYTATNLGKELVISAMKTFGTNEDAAFLAEHSFEGLIASSSIVHTNVAATGALSLTILGSSYGFAIDNKPQARVRGSNGEDAAWISGTTMKSKVVMAAVRHFGTEHPVIVSLPDVKEFRTLTTAITFDNTFTLWVQQTSQADWAARQSPMLCSNEPVCTPSTGCITTVYLMGGQRSLSVYYNDVWTIEDTTMTWSLMTSRAQWTARSKGATVWISNTIYILGGMDAAGSKQDVWSSSNGITWTQLNAAAFSVRHSFSCIMDVGGELLVTGGMTGHPAQYLSDVHRSSNGVGWSERTSRAEFGQRAQHAAVRMDSRVWVLGGATGNGFSHITNDVWSTTDNGITWTLHTSTPEWPARASFAVLGMQTEGINVLYLLGGYGQDSTTYNDVWSSTDWSEWRLNEGEKALGWWSVRHSFGHVYSATHSHLGGKIWVMSSGLPGTNDVWFMPA